LHFHHTPNQKHTREHAPLLSLFALYSAHNQNALSCSVQSTSHLACEGSRLISSHPTTVLNVYKLVRISLKEPCGTTQHEICIGIKTAGWKFYFFMLMVCARWWNWPRSWSSGPSPIPSNYPFQTI
jgi:hypothetical protein